MEDVPVQPVLFLIALAASMPTVDLNTICQSAKVVALPEDQASAVQSCVDDEKAARAQLQQKWGLFSAKARGACAESPGIAFSYLELLTCLEMQSGDQFNKPQVPPVTPSPSPAIQSKAPAVTVANTPPAMAPVVKPHKKVIPPVVVVVTNSRAVALTELDATPSGGALPLEIVSDLAPGKKTLVKVAHDKSCVFDLHGAYADGSSTDSTSVDLCKDNNINLVE
jgi:hypothetical protein